jgi:hypothetical protein
MLTGPGRAFPGQQRLIHVQLADRCEVELFDTVDLSRGWGGGPHSPIDALIREVVDCADASNLE